jgi:hypothetical protein
MTLAEASTLSEGDHILFVPLSAYGTVTAAGEGEVEVMWDVYRDSPHFDSAEVPITEKFSGWWALVRKSDENVS